MRIAHVLIAWAVLVGVKRALTRRRAGSRSGSLRYHVPPGQDPAVVLAAVRRSGLPATIAMDGGYEDVVVTCDPSRDRERVRAVLRASSMDMPGQRIGGPTILFADEQPA